MAAPPTAQDKVLYRYLTRRSSKGLGGLEPGVEPSGSLGFGFWYQKFTLGVAALGAERCNKEFTHCYAVCISDRDSGVSRGKGSILREGTRNCLLSGRRWAPRSNRCIDQGSTCRAGRVHAGRSDVDARPQRSTAGFRSRRSCKGSSGVTVLTSADTDDRDGSVRERGAAHETLP